MPATVHLRRTCISITSKRDTVEHRAEVSQCFVISVLTHMCHAKAAYCKQFTDFIIYSSQISGMCLDIDRPTTQ